MRQKIQANTNSTGDAIELLKNIEDTTYNYQSQKHLAHAIHDAKRRLYTFVQSRHMTTQTYYEQFNNLIDVVNRIGGTYGIEPGLLEQFAATRGKIVINHDTIEKAEAKEHYIAVAFCWELIGTDLDNSAAEWFPTRVRWIPQDTSSSISADHKLEG